ncbi:MAG: type IIL restriction-modification enzyme MmeI [Planctomycetaceae bacterium]
MRRQNTVFVFLDASVLPDNKLIVFGLDDAFHLGILSSYAHSVWALAMGGRLGVGNDPTYQNLRCFDMFPFPEHTTSNNERIRILAEQLDAHHRDARSCIQLTMTGMYNVLEKLREGEPLSDRADDS